MAKNNMSNLVWQDYAKLVFIITYLRQRLLLKELLWSTKSNDKCTWLRKTKEEGQKELKIQTMLHLKNEVVIKWGRGRRTEWGKVSVIKTKTNEMQKQHLFLHLSFQWRRRCCQKEEQRHFPEGRGSLSTSKSERSKHSKLISAPRSDRRLASFL